MWNRIVASTYLKLRLSSVPKRRSAGDAELAEVSRSLARTNEEVENFVKQLEMMRQSRWIKLGRLFGVGPDLQRSANSMKPALARVWIVLKGLPPGVARPCSTDSVHGSPSARRSS